MKVAILHEGKSIDKSFFKLLYKHLEFSDDSIDKNIKFIGMGSKSNFFKLDNNNYQLLKNEIEREEIEKVLFIADADYNGDKKYDGYEDTLRELKNIQKELKIETISDTFIAYDVDLETKEGYLESLILSTLSTEQKQCINNFLDCSEFTSKTHDKSIFNFIYKNAYPEAPYDFSHPNFSTLKEKLTNLTKE